MRDIVQFYIVYRVARAKPQQAIDPKTNGRHAHVVAGLSNIDV